MLIRDTASISPQASLSIGLKVVVGGGGSVLVVVGGGVVMFCRNSQIYVVLTGGEYSSRGNGDTSPKKQDT